MKRYVAFLDILGFSEKMEGLSQDDMIRYVRSFSDTVYRIWLGKKTPNIKGYIVSDSIIIYSNKVSRQDLRELLDLTIEVCRNEFVENGALLRCAIAKGEFDKVEVKELDTLKKGIIVGKAYINAYRMEEKAKHIGISLSKEVYDDIKELEDYSNNIFAEKDDSYYLRYLTLDFLIANNNIEKFVDMAIEARWLPHYYNTLYFALKGNDSSKRDRLVFIIILIRIIADNLGENWSKVDVFIKNAFAPDVVGDFQKRFLKFLRNSIIK